MDPGPFGCADRVLEDVDECSEVMSGHRFPFGDAQDECGLELGGAGAARRRVRERDHTEPRPCLHGQKLDLEPQAEAGLVGKDRRHLRHRVAGDHAVALLSPAGISRRRCLAWLMAQSVRIAPDRGPPRHRSPARRCARRRRPGTRVLLGGDRIRSWPRTGLRASPAAPGTRA